MKDIAKKTAVVTGANDGIGFEITIALAKMGMNVIMACRNLQKAEIARDKILQQVSQAELTVLALDVSEPDSITEFTRQFATQFGALDLLINNAGIVGHDFERNSVGHELQMATNYLGGFALTGRLLPQFRQDRQTRIINVNSLLHRFGKLALDDLNWESTPYNGWKGYARSKAASMAFTMELNRRLRQLNSNTIALAAHPGFAYTQIASKSGAIAANHPHRWIEAFMKKLIAPPVVAALPILHAACSESVQGGDYYGPGGLLEIRGETARAKINPVTLKQEAAQQLWALTEQLTGVIYPFEDAVRQRQEPACMAQ